VAVHYQPTGSTAAAISESVERGIRDNRLAPGAPLPSVRGLASDLGVSPATVAAAYRTLRDRGLVETAGRGGTRVRPRPPVASRLAHVLPVPKGALDLASGGPDPRLLPRLGPYLRQLDLAPATYDRGAGPLPELIELARERLLADRVRAPAITVTSGALDAIERILVAHLRPGDRIGVEDPGWANLLDLIAALGLVPVPMRLDEDGPTESGLHAALAGGARAIVFTSRAQNPTGAALTAARARSLGRLLRPRPDVLVIEDDHAGELAHDEPHSLIGMTRAWAHVRSLSKPYGPDLRLAVLSGDEATISRVEGRMRLGAGWVSTVLQRLAVMLWRAPDVTELIDVAREAYRERRLALLDALTERGIVASGRSGINVWVPVPDETLVVTRMREEGFAVAPGALYRIASPSAVRITVAPLASADAPRVADAMARALAPATARGRSA
jgi:DNA-binding transcriptional MocR family regulator